MRQGDCLRFVGFVARGFPLKEALGDRSFRSFLKVSFFFLNVVLDVVYMKKKSPLLLCLLVCMASACSLKNAATSTMSSIAWDGQPVLEQSQDPELSRKNILPMLTMLEVFAHENPTHKTTATLLAKSYGQYAFGFFEEDLLQLKKESAAYELSQERAKRFYEKGKQYGLATLSQKKSFRKALKLPLSDFEHALQSFGKKDVPLLFWTSFCWASNVNLNRDDPFAIAALPKVTAMLDRVLQLDANYYFSSALAFRAVLHASKPQLLGGNAEEAKKIFETTFKQEPYYLMHKVLYAQYYAVQIQDKALYQQILNEVVFADDQALASQVLANKLAKRRAAILLQKVDQFF